MTTEIPSCFSSIGPPLNVAENGLEWHFKAWVLWHVLPSRTPLTALAWLLGVCDSALDQLRKKKDWPRRMEMRRSEADEQRKKEKEISLPALTIAKKAADLIFDRDIPRVSLIKLIRFAEYMAQEAAKTGDPFKMSSWLGNLAGIDSAIKARKARQIDKIKRDSVKIYLPAQDATPAMDIEDARIVPPPVVF